MELGDLVSAGQTTLNTLSTTDPMAVDFEVNEKQLPHLTQLLEQPADSVFTIRLPDGTDYPNYGELMLIDRAVDRQTGTIRATAKNSERKRLFAGGHELHRAGAATQRRTPA